MTKLNLGDYVLVDYLHKQGYVVADRGGHVGRWRIKFDDGEVANASSRDCIVLIPSKPYNSRLTVSDKLDLLLDYLGLVIEDSPKLVKKPKATPTNKLKEGKDEN